jgi:hypothetical protein
MSLLSEQPASAMAMHAERIKPREVKVLAGRVFFMEGKRACEANGYISIKVDAVRL